MDGIKNINKEKPNNKESKIFWTNIWDTGKEHEKKCKMVKRMKSWKKQYETKLNQHNNWDDKRVR